MFKIGLIRNITYSTFIFTSYKVTNFACTVDVTLTKGVLCVVVTNDIPPCNLKCFHLESRPIFWVAVIKSLNRLFLIPKKNIRIIFNLSFKSNIITNAPIGRQNSQRKNQRQMNSRSFTEFIHWKKFLTIKGLLAIFRSTLLLSEWR